MGRVGLLQISTDLYRYAFKKEQEPGEPIEIEDDDDWIDPSRKFYWSPYSGELSLELPKTQMKARGGILADAMGELPLLTFH